MRKVSSLTATRRPSMKFFFSSRRRHTRFDCDWSSDVCSSDLLHRVLRSERGLTYGASADTQAMKQAGDYVAETDTETGNTGEVLRLTVEEFSRLQRQRVGGRELADAQAYLAGSFPLTLEKIGRAS